MNCLPSTLPWSGGACGSASGGGEEGVGGIGGVAQLASAIERLNKIQLVLFIRDMAHHSTCGTIFHPMRGCCLRLKDGFLDPTYPVSGP
jgi:hypothetical protein